jgi:hypothetical protein
MEWIGSSDEARSSRFLAKSSGIVTRRIRIMISGTFSHMSIIGDMERENALVKLYHAVEYEENLPKAS